MPPHNGQLIAKIKVGEVEGLLLSIMHCTVYSIWTALHGGHAGVDWLTCDQDQAPSSAINSASKDTEGQSSRYGKCLHSNVQQAKP